MLPPSVMRTFSMSGTRFTFSHALVFTFACIFTTSSDKISRLLYFFCLNGIGAQMQVILKLGAGDSCLWSVLYTNNNRVNNRDRICCAIDFLCLLHSGIREWQPLASADVLAFLPTYPSV